jgi:hypothetical protein
MYTRYPVAANPVLTDGADHESWIDDAVWLTLTGAEPAAGAVDCENTSLRSPSPDALTALTANLYDRPPTSPVTSTDDVKAPRYASVDTAADSPAPTSRYSTYSVTVSPPFSTGAIHSNVMLLVVCDMLDSAVGATAAVDCSSTSLRSPSPAALTALTTNLYSVPPDSPLMPAVVPLPEYTSDFDPSAATLYTAYAVTAAPPTTVEVSQVSLIEAVVCCGLETPVT